MITTIILSVIITLSVIVNIIQYYRQVQLEKTIDTIQLDEKLYYDFFDKICIGINHSYQNLDRLDKRGAFKNDDEVGFTFKAILTVVNDLNLFLGDARRKIEEKEKE